MPELLMGQHACDFRPPYSRCTYPRCTAAALQGPWFSPWMRIRWQVLFNFRADRMVEISKAFEYKDFDAFDRKRFPKVVPIVPLVSACICTPNHIFVLHVRDKCASH